MNDASFILQNINMMLIKLVKNLEPQLLFKSITVYISQFVNR